MLVYRLVTKGTVEERILKRARQKESVQSTVYGANLKADSFSTRDVVDMIIDDVEDVGATTKSEVKGFIKSGKRDTKKRGRKNKSASKDPVEMISRISAHEKYEHEFDELVKGLDLDPVEIEEGSEGEQEEIEEVKDKRGMLMKILEGEGKVIRLEADEGGVADDKAEEKKKEDKKRGRPKKDIELDDDDEGLSDEEMEY